MAKTALISIETLHQLLRCDAEAGKLYWKPRPLELFPDARSHKIWNTKFAGKEAFYTLDISLGYLMGSIFNKRYYAHRVIWAMYYGEWPTEQIDHINHHRNDNRIPNLRGVSKTVNSQNRPLSRANKSGFCGVCYIPSRNKWGASIQANGKYVFLGEHLTKAEAIDARMKANVKYGFHQNHGLSKEATQT